jgi:hypothetical protein
MIKSTFTYFSFLILLITVSSCSRDDEFTVEKNRVGLITSETKVMDIEGLFKNDSIVSHLSEGVLGYRGRYSQEDDFYLIYSKEGKHLLTLTPNEPLDSLSTIRVVDIHDGIYITKDGIGLNSTFEEINLAMNVSKIESTFTKVVLYLDQMNATITLAKVDLGINTIQTNDVQLEQIPNLVKPKSFVIWFD